MMGSAQVTIYTYIFLLAMAVAVVIPMEPILKIALIAIGLTALHYVVVTDRAS